MSSIHLIRIPDREDRKRAIKAFMDVPFSWMSFPDNVLGITGEHLKALQSQSIPFEETHRSARNGQ